LKLVYICGACCRKTITVADITDTIAVLHWTTKAGSAITLEELEAVLSEETFAVARKQLKRLAVREELVLKLKLSVSNGFLYSNHAAASVGGGSAASAESSTGAGETGTAATGVRKGLSKMERKKMKKKQEEAPQSVGSSAAPPPATVAGKPPASTLPSQMIEEEFCILIRRGDDIVQHGQMESEKCFFVRNHVDLCESMAAVLTQFKKLQDDGEI
jgi:hypothetical protein